MDSPIERNGKQRKGFLKRAPMMAVRQAGVDILVGEEEDGQAELNHPPCERKEKNTKPEQECLGRIHSGARDRDSLNFNGTGRSGGSANETRWLKPKPRPKPWGR